ncbi:VanZ family protein [Longimicrobium sp.]|uniref:VanZ family protein n=1 Tax=Longimicrobium sp. TaxID=2029185 RepID=UPI002E3000A0|nr:VanZ family protein [Longimicrobium sp.]HEX6039612.1 VanZ family protein [Longimicrobium sp.]
MVPRFMYPLLPYRSMLVPFLAVGAVAVPCWLAVRLHRVRSPGIRLSVRREMLLLAFVVYLSGLASATLTPNHGPRARAEAAALVLRPDPASLTCSAPSLPRGSTERSFCVRNARGNVVLFFPFGLLLPLVWPGLRVRRGMQTALALSVGIELVQYLSRAWGSYRTADVNDVILNVLGAGLGLGVMYLPRLRRGPRPDPSAR